MLRALELHQVDEEEADKERGRANSNKCGALEASGEGGSIGNLLPGEKDPPPSRALLEVVHPRRSWILLCR